MKEEILDQDKDKFKPYHISDLEEGEYIKNKVMITKGLLRPIESESIETSLKEDIPQGLSAQARI